MSLEHYTYLFSSTKPIRTLVSLCCCCLVARSCPTFCDFMDCSPPGSSVHGISQARILECHFLLQGIFLSQGANLHFLHWQADSLPLSHQESPLNTLKYCVYFCCYTLAIMTLIVPQLKKNDVLYINAYLWHLEK